MIGKRPFHPSGLRGYCFWCRNCELGVPLWLALQTFHQSTLWDLLISEEGGSRDSPLGSRI
jgi:hypothetical protein